MTTLKTSHSRSEDHFHDVTLTNGPFWRHHTCKPRTTLKTSYFCPEITDAGFGNRDVLIPDLNEQYRAVDVRASAWLAMTRHPLMYHSAFHAPLRHPAVPVALTSVQTPLFVRPLHVDASTEVDVIVHHAWVGYLKRKVKVRSAFYLCIYLLPTIMESFKYSIFTVVRDTVARQHCWIQYFSCLKFRSCLTTMSNIMIMLQSGATV